MMPENNFWLHQTQVILSNKDPHTVQPETLTPMLLPLDLRALGLHPVPPLLSLTVSTLFGI